MTQVSRDIVSFSGSFGWSGWESAGLVVAGGVRGEFADQFSGVACDDADVQVVDQEGDSGSGSAGAQADVVQAAVVAAR